MTDKEQALVAAAYRAAAEVCEKIDEEYEGDDVLATWCAEAIKCLDTIIAEAKLRALMLKAAFSVASSIYTNAEVEKVVDEVLNGHQ